MTIRFGCGNPKERCSSIWNVVIPMNSSDIMLSARSIMGILKVSLHASGKWRYAFTREHWQSRTSFAHPDEDRAQEKWQRPPEFVPGWTKALFVVFPQSELAVPPVSLIESSKHVFWYDEPPPGHAAQLTLLFVSRGVDATRPPPIPPNDQINVVDSRGLPNGETLCLVAQTYRMSIEMRDQLQHGHDLMTAAKEKGIRTNREPPTYPRGFLFGRAPDGARYFVDVNAA